MVHYCVILNLPKKQHINICPYTTSIGKLIYEARTRVGIAYVSTAALLSMLGKAAVASSTGKD